MCKFPLTGCLQKFYQNLTTESGSKQRFNLLQSAVIQAVCLRTQAVSIKARFQA